ncbi:DUF397 domain-containing protein [Streptoalloteichus hindustanus]|uniref:DUF397 domain-containing protein n=1 Tax=Streptoalloteichus hindustanus TaxID=2017 RepID=A0A1M5DQ70_STRHI|nr:DUF397 domain-containing protein [Streptoalloteichus hindustanus]SHF68991.1 protein of unknown function [Streptoalloteichus hindustanus]
MTKWRKSSRSTDNGDCVETALFAGEHVGMRDSKNPAGGTLTADRATFTAFIAAVKADRIGRR